MSKKNRIHYSLSDVKGIQLNEEEMEVILRAADEIIFAAGRSMLALILKGSKSKQLLEHHLNECPSYGYYHTKSIEEITTYVDWMIVHQYLEISYNGQLPLIVFAEKGWELLKPIYAKELFNKILNVKDEDQSSLISTLLNVNRQVIVLLIHDIGFSENTKFLEFLKAWEKKEAKKVRLKLKGAIKKLDPTT